FFLRIDFRDPARVEIDQIKLRIVFRNSASRAVVVTFFRSQPDQSVSCEIRREEETPDPPALWGQAALGKIFEMRVSLAAIGIGSQEPFEFQVTVWEEDFRR